MTSLEAWLEGARRDAERRELPALGSLLETLSRSTAVLRAADWNVDATDRSEPSSAVPEDESDVSGQDGSAPRSGFPCRTRAARPRETP